MFIAILTAALFGPIEWHSNNATITQVQVQVSQYSRLNERAADAIPLITTNPPLYAEFKEFSQSFRAKTLTSSLLEIPSTYDTVEGLYGNVHSDEAYVFLSLVITLNMSDGIFDHDQSEFLKQFSWAFIEAAHARSPTIYK